MGGTGMTQDVWTQPRTETGPVAVLLDSEPRTGPGHPSASRVEEHGLGIAPPGPAFGGQRRSPLVEPHAQSPQGRPAERHDALLGTLAEGPQQGAVEIDVGERQTDELGDADAGAVQHLEDRPVALVDRVVADHAL